MFGKVLGGWILCVDPRKANDGHAKSSDIKPCRVVHELRPGIWTELEQHLLRP